MKFSFIPEKKNIEKALELYEKYGMYWELNDFMYPSVYDDKAAVQRTIDFYKSCGRDLSKDTMHGAFFGVDIAAIDPMVRERSRDLCRQSMDIASQLSLRGVVFHTGLIGTLRLPDYVNRWLTMAEEFFGGLCREYPNINIYLENSFEQEPDVFIKIMEKMKGHANFKLCLDYGHAILTPTPVDEWFAAFSPYLCHMHLNDNDLNNDLHLCLGDGKIDFDKWHSLLSHYNYDGSVLLEMNGYEKAERSIRFIKDNGYDSTERNVSLPQIIDRRKTDRRKMDRLQKILDIGITLSVEKDADTLLSYILDNAMELTNCDGGSLYILGDDKLYFRIMKTRSKGVDRILPENDTTISPITLNEGNVCAYAAIHKKSLNIPDVYTSGLFDFSGPKNYDKNNGYTTKSMVTIPMIDHMNEVIGVMQLINAMDGNGNLIEFSDDDEKIISSLASQTAICLSNMTYLKELDKQMWSFTEALTEVIDMRTPYNGNHTKQVAKYAGLVADYFNEMHEKEREDVFFTEEHKAQLVMAAYLHDIGKMTTPIKVMNKATRLEHYIDGIMSRFENIRLRYKVDFLEDRISREEYENCIAKLDRAENLANEVNSDKFLTDELEALVDECSQYKYEGIDDAGNAAIIPFFTDEEITCMKIKKGTLTDEERQIMQDHVVITKKILDKVYFNRSYAFAPVWASQHHEFINGTGYPNHLAADDLCIESRILAACDICDALLSTDRPYKKPMPKEKAFAIMRAMAEEGKLDLKCVEYLEACVGVG